jgi:hypothetical protein
MGLAVDYRQLDDLVRAMFRHDRDGRLTGAAPLLHIVRTDKAVLCRCHAVVPDATAARIQALAAAPRGRPNVWADDYARYLAVAEGVGFVTAVRAGPLFRFPDELPETAECLPINRTNLDLLRGSLDEWVEDAQQGSAMAAAIVDGRAVSVCATVRASRTVHCAGVETAPAYRGQALAQHAVVAWAKLVRTAGAEPYYATTFDNTASQKVASRIGLRLIGSEFSIYGPASAQRIK